MAKTVKNNKFIDWIKKTGILQLAIKFGCHQATAEGWVAFRTIPTIPNMKKLIEMGNGEFTYADIIEPFYEANPHLLEK